MAWSEVIQNVNARIVVKEFARLSTRLAADSRSLGEDPIGLALNCRNQAITCFENRLGKVNETSTALSEVGESRHIPRARGRTRSMRLRTQLGVDRSAQTLRGTHEHPDPSG